MATEVTFEGVSCPVPLPDAALDRIVMGHGSGGRLSHTLIRSLFLPDLHNAALAAMNDGAVLELPTGAGRLVVTTDAHVVRPLFFPGGDIGRLAVCGTVNDVAMMGGRPLWLTAAFILEEGLPLTTLQRAVRGMQEAAAEAGVQVAAGDTKVVERGSAGGGLFIATAGVGWVAADIDIAGANARPGDVVLVSGTLGDHGIAVLSAREELGFETELRSDVAPLNGLVAALLAAAPGAVHVLRDPTRGGLATTLNEIAAQSGVAIEIEEQRIPLRPAVRAACEMLGFDPLYVANEGKLVACVAPEAAEAALAALRGHRYGAETAIIGRVREGPAGQVTLRTPIGGARLLDMLTGEMLPRIC
jgi:hydrogenase expression/formation protein HypE